MHTNLDYDLVIKRVHLHYDMKLVAFGIDSKLRLYHTISSVCSILQSLTTYPISN